MVPSTDQDTFLGLKLKTLFTLKLFSQGPSMKKLYYAASLLILGTFLIISPVSASLEDPKKAETPAVSETEKKPDLSQDGTDIQKKAEVARKEIVATVNGVPINMYDLTGMMNRVTKAYYSNVKNPNPETTLIIKRRALDRLIFEELAVKEAVEQGIKINPEDVQKVIDNLKMAYVDDKGYQNYLDGIGITEEQLRQRITHSRLLEGITGREVYQKVSIEQDDVEKMYKEYKEAGKLQKADEFFVHEILVMAGKDAAETRANGDRMLALLKKNDYDFNKLLLDGTFIVREVRIHKEKYPVIYEKMLTMKVDEFSPVVKDGDSYHIFKVLKNNLARDMTREEARAFIEDRLAPYSQKKRHAEWATKLLKGSNIVYLDEDIKKMEQEEKIKAETVQLE